MKPPVIIIFCKAPRLGAVKTRLARDIGEAQALRFYRATLDATIRHARAIGVADIVLCVTPDHDAASADWPRDLARIGQGEGDLGVRMARALAGFRDRHRILIGGDIPDMRPTDLRHAMRLLHRHDAIFAPAEDGGFWLVGLAQGRQPPGFLQSVSWSTPETLAGSLATLPDAWRVGLARRLNDVDDVEDYRGVMNRR
ncbi:MAG: TIGR04282 family arsenosugar biosynthesis glycosyltransferase [Minwuia sp.]|nr:TIGR04282 family arsenosugar biosynthesis glycosyltransferase [Minwuia sp.]